jgi:cytochrome c oxidase assembly factor CtaG
MTLPQFSLLHSSGSYPSGWLHSDWRPEPTVILGVFALIAAYLWWTGPKNRTASGEAINPVSGGQRVAFVAGSLVALIALNPPLDDWADSYLLSAHMFQHLLLMFVTAPLWLAGMPDWLLRRIVIRRPLTKIGYFVTRPVPALVISNSVITFWHMTSVYDAALGNEPLHVVQHMFFVIASLIAWWPVFGSLAEWPRLSQPMACLYLFALSIPGGIVGAFVTLAEPGLYRPYTLAPRIFGLDLATDQEIAGLMMWVLTSFVYLLIITFIFFKWAAAEEAKEGRGPFPPVQGNETSTSLLADSTTTGASG